jgi:hypothetical protein
MGILLGIIPKGEAGEILYISSNEDIFLSKN